jgi:DNA relaxase NicK
MKKRGRPFKVKAWANLSGLESMQLGARSSLHFGRIYDKGLESKEHIYKGALRFEMQLNKELAEQMGALLDRTECQGESIASICDAWFQEHHVAPILSPCFFEQKLAAEWKPLVSSVSKELGASLTWMSVQVKPTIERLCRIGKRAEVLEALGLSDLAQTHLSEHTEVQTDWSN